MDQLCLCQLEGTAWCIVRMIDIEMQMILQNLKSHLITTNGTRSYYWEFA